MSTNFLDYAKFYNLLYKDKDYIGECKFIHELILKYHPDAKTILDVLKGRFYRDDSQVKTLLVGKKIEKGTVAK